MKKLFGKINLTWKKLIIFAIVAGVFTALMALIPITKDTSFRDIAISFEWWILFGIIIICNSKSPRDSALKCFVFFLISQPLIYLIQVPFSPLGFQLFKYYKYWFMWTILTIPMGFIGYYINKKNIISLTILLPMLMIVAFQGIGYFSSVIENFPHHLLSLVACCAIIIIVLFSIFDKKIYKIIGLSIIILFTIIYILLKGGIFNQEFETYRSIDDFGITYEGKLYVSYFSGTANGNVTITQSIEHTHTVKLNGRKKGKYKFSIIDDNNIEYEFEYYFNKDKSTVELKRIK